MVNAPFVSFPNSITIPLFRELGGYHSNECFDTFYFLQIHVFINYIALFYMFSIFI